MSVDYVKANENIVQDTKDLLLWQFNDSENIQKLIEIVAEEYGGYEEVAERIFTSFLLTEATGFALDSIGEFLNFPRQGQNDDEYRTALVFSAIGANSTVARDDIANLLDVVTGGIGGYFYRGRYHDLYIYLQESCIDKEVATGFIDRYLPINTNASILFESGTAFGFENNPKAAGFDKVRALPAEGGVAIQYPYEALATPSGAIIANGDLFEDADGNTYRTDGDNDLEDTTRGLKWDISGYSVGDTIGFTARNNISGDVLSETFEIQSSVPEEIAHEITKVLVENGSLTQTNAYLSEGLGDVLYVGYDSITDESLFSSRATSAVEYNQFEGQATTVASNVIRHTYDDTGATNGIVYETYSKNLLPHGNYPDDVTGDWTVVGTVDAQGTDNTLEYIDGIPSVTYSVLSGDSASVSKTVSTERDGYHSFSFFVLPDALTYTVKSRANELVFTYDAGEFTEVSSDFTTYATENITIEGQECLRVTVTDTYDASESVDLEIAAIADQGSGATLQITCAQFEPWISSTSYIPTEGSAQERAQDIFSISEDLPFVGIDDNHTFILENVQGSLNLWSYGFFVATYSEERVVPEGTVFTPVDSYGLTINTIVSLSGWYDGFGDEQNLQNEDPSYSESGKFCTRASLTSRDILGLSQVGVGDGGAFEYELDSRFSEVISYVSTETSYARPIVPVTAYREFRGPDWDDTVIDPAQPEKIYTSGVALRSPQATTQVASPETSLKRSVAKVTDGDPLSYTNNIGDIEVSNKSFYFEFQLADPINAPSIDELYASADFAFSEESTQASTTTTTDVVLRMGLVTEYRSATSDYEVSVQVIALKNTLETNSVSGASSEDNYQVIAKPYSQTYSNVNNAQAITAGFLVDPVQNIIRLYIDGETYDGNGGIIEITSLGADHNDSETIVGDILTIPAQWDSRLLFQIGGSTNVEEPEPTALDDYGSVRFNYAQEHFQFIDQLPQNTVDIFGRIIDNGA